MSDETLQIKVDFSTLTIGDMALFDKFKDNQASNTELVKFLDRVVVGGASHLPLTALQDVMSALQDAVTEMSNPVVNEKN